MNHKTVLLTSMMGGKVQQQFDNALQSVLLNLKDEDVPHKAKRKITINFNFTTDEDRMELEVEAEVKAKLVPQNTLASRYWIEQEYDEITIEELKSNIKGQLQIDSETGEIHE